MKYFITLFLLLAVGVPVWGDSLPADRFVVSKGFILEVEAEDGRTHLFKPLVVDECIEGHWYPTLYDGMGSTSLLPDSKYICDKTKKILEWQHMGVK